MKVSLKILRELRSHPRFSYALEHTEDYAAIAQVHPSEEHTQMLSTSQGDVTMADAYNSYKALSGSKRLGNARTLTERQAIIQEVLASNAGRPARSSDGASTKRKTVRLTTSEYERSQQLLAPGESWSSMVRRILLKECALHDARKRIASRGKGE